MSSDSREEYTVIECIECDYEDYDMGGCEICDLPVCDSCIETHVYSCKGEEDYASCIASDSICAACHTSFTARAIPHIYRNYSRLYLKCYSSLHSCACRTSRDCACCTSRDCASPIPVCKTPRSILAKRHRT